MINMQLPIMTKRSQGKDLAKGIFKEVFKDGIIGGYTFSDGAKSLIYQCGECGKLCEFNTTYNKHRKQEHGLEGVQFGWAEGEPEWGCFTDKINENLIMRAIKK